MIEKIQISDITIGKDYLGKIVSNTEYNKIIGDYYFRFYKEMKDEKILRKREKLLNCNSLWFLDKYEKAKIKDFKTTNLCEDKFCNNCKKVKQASRMSKFIPLLEPYAKDMYQLTLTVPNVKGELLGQAINHIFVSFSRLIELLKGKKEINGLDFLSLKYEGAIRSLEVTFKDDSYHPHIHALLVLKGKISSRTHENVFSNDFTGSREKRLFTDEEILIQKVWRLLYDGEVEKVKNGLKRSPKITSQKIQELDRGYSCTLDKFKESDFLELFKYMTKSTDEKDKALTYKNFKVLYSALLNKRQIQGYGCFYGLEDVNKITAEEICEMYNSIIEGLKKEENPVGIAESPTELIKDKDYTIISRKKVGAFLRQLNKQ